MEAVVAEIRQKNKVICIEPEKWVSSPSYLRYLHITAYEELFGKTLDAIKDFLNRNPYRLTMPFAHLQSQMVKITDKQVF